MNRALAYIIIGAVVILTLDVARSDRDELEQRKQEYCEMTQLHKDTNGQLGWPDYRGDAARVCK